MIMGAKLVGSRAFIFKRILEFPSNILRQFNRHSATGVVFTKISEAEATAMRILHWLYKHKRTPERHGAARVFVGGI